MPKVLKGPELGEDAAARAERSKREAAARARAARLKAEDRAHELTLARYGTAWEKLFRANPKRPK